MAQAREDEGMGQRAFRYRIYPTAPQTIRLTQMLRDHCELYNAALQERRGAWKHQSKTSVNYNQQAAQLKDIRASLPHQGAWSATSQQQTLRRLDKAFQSFFRRVKSGEAPGYPRFRSHARFDSVDFRHGDGAKYTDVREGWGDLYVKGVGHVKVRTHRALPGSKLGHMTVKREGSGRRAKWFLVLIVEVADQALEPTGREVGIDLGVASFAITSDGQHIPNPRHLAKSADQLADAQRDLARKKRGSARRRKAVERVASIHAKVARQRLDHLHKTTHALVRDHDVLVMEDLRIASMTRRAKPVPDPAQPGTFLPNGAAAKSGINRSILDASWGRFTSIMTVKAESAGRKLIFVNPAYTSQKCAECGRISKDNRLTQEAFRCVSCGHAAHADVNAAINILRAGTARRHALA